MSNNAEEESLGQDNPRRLVDPQLLTLIDLCPPVALSDLTLPGIRSSAVAFLPPPEAELTVAVTRRAIPGPAGAPDVSMVMYTPLAARGAIPCIIHMHGGGFVAGSANVTEPRHVSLATELGCKLVSVDYRLAPETRFPGAVEDCYAVMTWLFDHADDLGIDVSRIGVMGESAGGGLAAALCLLARDRAQYRLAFQQLASPMLDDRTCTRSTDADAPQHFLWTAQQNAFAWQALLGVSPGSPGLSPYAAPARAQDLRGLPPCCISIGALDLFLDEALEYARRLAHAAVPVELHVYEGACHAFQYLADSRVARAALRDTVDALRRRIA